MTWNWMEKKAIVSMYVKFHLYILIIDYLKMQKLLKFYNWFLDALMQSLDLLQEFLIKREGLGFHHN